jgi:pilus assembly protein Flp/PilA
MRQMVSAIVRFMRDERGATAIEYGFIAALMSVATIALITQIGVNVGELTSRVMDGFR